MTRPSQLLSVSDEVVAFALDEALDMRLTIATLKAEQGKTRKAPPPGTRWATAAEQGVDDYEAAWADSQGALEAIGNGR